ncbi:MAG: YHYH domain-containing protein, partial [Patescibacteria group bacterium]
MKKFLLTFTLLVASYIFLPNTEAQAHPGNTDSLGGHTCRTNCTSWGLNYGEYHFHNNSSTPSFSYPSYTPPAPTITVKSFLVSKVFGYDKIVIADSSDYYIVTTGYGCYSSTFYEGQTIYIDTYSSPSYFDDIYTSTNASSKKCSITNSDKVNLKPYYVDSVIDTKDNIIVSDKNNDSYLVEYGIGCLSMWRAANKTIYIDIGGIFLDGIGDKIYLFD